VLTTVGRRVRGAATVAALLALLWGTFWGEDDHFPFGPFRMYSVRNELDGEVRSLQLEGTNEAGKSFEIRTEKVGLRRADIEGQVGKLQESPDWLASRLVHAYERFNPDEPPLVRLRLYERVFQMEDGRPVEEHEETLAVWRRS
jgi:hypothetical protein